MHKLDTKQRFRGALIGLAVGDALGSSVEFQASGTFEPVGDITGGGVFGLPAGAWTDDTSMALCLADSPIEMKIVKEMVDPSSGHHEPSKSEAALYLSAFAHSNRL